MLKNSWPLAMLAVTLAIPVTNARAHEIVGNRFFPATLAIDDPGVNDELALPTISMSKTGDDPSFKQLDVSAEFAKRITEDFAISVAPTWSRLYAPGGMAMNGARGFQNLETLFKYRLLKNAEHEFVLSAGLEIEWGGTGAQGVGAEPFNIYTPALFFGKGFGDLPPASIGRGHSQSPAKLVTQFRAHQRQSLQASTPIPANRKSKRSSTRVCSTGAARSNTACPTSNPRWWISAYPISLIGSSRSSKRRSRRRCRTLRRPEP